MAPHTEINSRDAEMMDADEKSELAAQRAAAREMAAQEADSITDSPTLSAAQRYLSRAGTSQSFQTSQYQNSNTPPVAEILGNRSFDSDEKWIRAYWRPAMGWTYLLTCLADFVIFPILWSLLQTIQHGSITQQWSPITLLGGGLYHLAMGAIVSVTSHGRTKEKLNSRN